MPYPEPLLPKALYAEAITTGDLVQYSADFYLVRVSNGPIEDIDNIKIRELCPSTKDFIGLSTNLLGIFELSHLPFKAIRRPIPDYWIKTDGAVGSDTIAYDEVGGRAPIFIRLHALHDRELPATKTVDQKTLTIAMKILVSHRPTKPNYWHFEVRVFNVTDQQEFDRERVPEWAKNAIKTFVQIDICQKASGRPPVSATVIPNVLFIDRTDEAAVSDKAV